MDNETMDAAQRGTMAGTASRRGAGHGAGTGVKMMAAFGVMAALAGPVLAGCAEPRAVPADDEYAGVAESSASGAGRDDGWSSDPDSSPTATGDAQLNADTGTYRDGTYASTSTYGPVGEDSIDVSVTVASDTVTAVSVTGHAFTSISEGHQNDFISAIGGVVVGQPLSGLSVDTVAGASWTTDAFNAALDVIRQEAADPNAASASASASASAQ